MNPTEPSASPAQTHQIAIPEADKLDFILGRIDFFAIVITLLGFCLLGVVAAVMAVIELARLLATLWEHPVDRWLIITLGVAIVWVVARWKKSSVV